MGFAIIKGIVSSDIASSAEIFAFDPDCSKIEGLREFGVTPCGSEQELVNACKYVFLAVKPQIFGLVLEKIADMVTPLHVLVSIAAGITAEYIASKTVDDAKVVLAMPNTPLLLGQGASAISRNAMTGDEEFEVVCNIFGSCGITAILPENKMKEIIAVNASSPAFIYLFAKGFIEYAQEQGIDEISAKRLFSQTLIGSAKMLTDTGFTADELIKQVSSPGGTTLAGLEELYNGNLTGVVKNACEACTRRAYELSK